MDWLSGRAIDEAEPIEIEAKDEGSAVVLRNGDMRLVVMPMAAE